MRNLSDERLRAVLERAAGARRRSRPPRRSHVFETCLGACAVLFAFLAAVATYPDRTNDILDRAAIAFLHRDAPQFDMQTTASIEPRAPSVAQQNVQRGPQGSGQGDGPVRARIHIDMGEETLRGGL